MTPGYYEVEFYRADSGSMPVRTWLNKLSGYKQRAAIAAIERVLARFGPSVCRTEFGKALGGGLYEFRIRHGEAEIAHWRTVGPPEAQRRAGETVLLRIYFCVQSQELILLLAAYDKAEHSSKRFESRQITVARKRLANHQRRRSR